jgi:magnesium transporter
MLVNCVVYRQGTKLADVAVESISDHLCQPDAFVWVALRDPSQQELEQMQDEFNLHDLAVEDALKGHQRPKIEEYGDTLFVAMHLVEYSPTDELVVGEVHVFASPHFVLSLRKRSTQRLPGRARSAASASPQRLRLGAGFVLYALMDAVVDRLLPACSMRWRASWKPWRSRSLNAARRAAQHRAAVRAEAPRTTTAPCGGPAADGQHRLHGGRVPRCASAAQDYFRDISTTWRGCDSAIDAIRDTIGTAIQVNLSMVTIEESETTKRLAAWAAIFAVSHLSSSAVWGMNFEHMPELKTLWGYPAALGLIGATCGTLWWRFRRAGWL